MKFSTRKLVEPNDFSLINQQVQEPIVSLITCTPPGTSWQRLFVQARQISPAPDKSKAENQAKVPATGKSVPSAAPSLLNKLLESIF